MSLRATLQTLVAVVTLVLIATMMALFIADTRRSVGEEISASNRITQQLLRRLILVGSQDGLASMADYLRDLGRVRANDIALYDAGGKELYRSPPPTYKAGREAPAWFATLVQPTPQTYAIDLVGGRLLIATEASRAVLDGWDDMLQLLAVALAMFLSANVIVYLLVGRAVAPFERIVASLGEIESGAFHTRLPALPGREARALGAAFNRMAGAVEGSLEARREAAASQARLAVQRELTHALHARIEEERRSLARELHDELGQEVTAIRSLALAIAQRASGDVGMQDALRALTATSNRLYDSMHAMVPRLRPPALDTLGLIEAIKDLVDDWRLRAPDTTFELCAQRLAGELSEALRIGAYRIVQEALSNAVRHARARHIAVHVEDLGDALEVTVRDDGIGLPGDAESRGRFGLLGMRERAEALGGQLHVGAAAGSGSSIEARLPLDHAQEMP